MGRNRNNCHLNKNINRKTKIHLVFDADARKEFLSGFHTRKLQRKKKAKDELQQQLKDEKKRLKLEARNAYKKLVNSHHPIPELEKLHSEEINLENHCISICELSTAEMSLKNNWIGQNQVQYGDKDDTSLEKSDEQDDTVHGMSLTNKKDLKKILKKQATSNAKQSKPLQRQMQQESRKSKKKSSKKKMLASKLKSKSKKRKG